MYLQPALLLASFHLTKTLAVPFAPQSEDPGALTVPDTSPFTLTDPDGNDLPIFSANVTPTLSKRANIGVNCDQFDPSGDRISQTYRVFCERERGARAYFCEAGSKQVHGSCGAHQICVDGMFSQVYGHVKVSKPWAYCSDQDNYVKLSMELLKKLQGQNRFSRALKWYRKVTDFLPGRRTAAPGPDSGPEEEHIMEAVFTGPGGIDDPVKLDGIDVVAVSSRLDLSQGVKWNALEERTCEQCSSLGIEPVPDATTMFAISPQYPPSMLTGADDAIGGYMYFWQV